MHIGLIGAGTIGAAHTARLSALEQVTQVSIADVSPERTEALAAAGGAKAAQSVDELLASGLDGVVITASTSEHAQLLHRALDLGLPVFCEKPIALDIASTRDVVQHAAEAGTPVQMGFQRRFDAGYRAAKTAADSGELGRVHTLRAVTADEVPPPAVYVPTSGGLFRDCNIHDFDILRWFTGREVVQVFASGSANGEQFFRDAGDIDTGASLLRFDNDVLATVTASRYNGAGHDVRLEVAGDRGGRVVGLDDRAPLVTAEKAISWQQSDPYHTYLQRFDAAYEAELVHFTDVVAGRAASPCTAADALEALYIAEACVLSASRNEMVLLEEVRS